MQEKLLQILIRLIFFVPFIKLGASTSLYQFIQLPSVIQMLSYSPENTLTVSDVTQCASIILPTTVGLVFVPSTNTCTTYSKFVGYNTRVTGNVYYLKIANKCGACATSTEAKAAIINYVYGQNACPDSIFTYDDQSGYCVGKISAQVPAGTTPYYCNYASYTQGAYTNGTLLVMSRGQAVTALNYLCPFANSTPSTFNGNWYCYTPFTTSSPSNSYVLNNICATWISGGTVIKYIHAAEPAYLSIRIGANAATGICLPTGALPYTYYDGTTVPSNYLTWKAGYPTGKPLVFLSNNLTLFDGTSTTMIRLMCRSAATLA